MEKFVRFHRDKRAFTWALGFAIVYFVFYLWSIQNILFTDSGFEHGFLLVANWQDLLFRQRVALLWEPIAVWVPLSGFSLLFAPPNILLAFFLSILIYANILVAVYAYRMNKITGVKFSFKGILGSLPAVLTGFACCAPTFVIAIGAAFSGFTVLFTSIRPWLIPISVVIMIWGYWYVSRNISLGRMETYERTSGKMFQSPAS